MSNLTKLTEPQSRDAPSGAGSNGPRFGGAGHGHDSARSAEEKRDGERQGAARHVFHALEAAVVDLLFAAGAVEIDDAHVSRDAESDCGDCSIARLASHCESLVRAGMGRFKGALVADLVDGYSPHLACEPNTVERPPIDAVKTLGTNIAVQYPQSCVSKSVIEKASAGRGDERIADTAAPQIGVDVEGAQLSVAGEIRVACRRCGGESLNRARFDSNDGPGYARVGIAESVPLCAIFGAKLIEEIVGQQLAVSNLPGAYVYACDRHGIVRFGWTQ